MRVSVFSAHAYDRDALGRANALVRDRHQLVFHPERLEKRTARLARGADAVCLFPIDRADAGVLGMLAEAGVRLLALRCAGTDHVDLTAAARLGMEVANVPAYSPESIGEHAVALMLALARRLPEAHERVRRGNLSLEGLTGFTLGSRTVGLVGAGRIGLAVARILHGFGCTILASDPVQDPELLRHGGRYVDLPELLARSEIVSLHCPLVPETRHLIDRAALRTMKPGAMLINTARGGVLDTRAAITALESGRLGALGLDVYEREAGLFFEDRSDRPLRDDVFARLLTFRNVLVTGHQGFLTQEALKAIATETIANLDGWDRDGRAAHPVPLREQP